MDSSNNQASNISKTDNWSDGLLVKDEHGNFSQLGQTKNDKDNQVSVVKNSIATKEKLAPQDANFVPMQNIMGNSQSKSELVFHPDDKEEVDFIAQNLPQDDSKKYSVEKISDRIIEKQKLDLDVKNKKIFVNILYNFFRNRKSTVITRELLTKSVLTKNKKLASDNVNLILSVIKDIKSKIDAQGGLVVNNAELKAKADLLILKEKKTQTTPKVFEIEDSPTEEISVQDEIKNALGELSTTKPISKVKKEEKISNIKEIEIKPKPAWKTQKTKAKDQPKTDIVKEKPKDRPKEVEKQPAEGFAIPSIGNAVGPKAGPGGDKVSGEAIEGGLGQEIKSQVELKPKPPKAGVSPEVSLPKVTRPNMAQATKKNISDVVTPVKKIEEQPAPTTPKSVLTGPVQELQSFDLVGFRRLGETAEERVKKILARINLLEQDSYTKKAQGIAAWRDSEVYKIYLQIGTGSMVAGKEVADFIKQKQVQNEDILSIEEFSSISDLNKQLRF
jgi:hypothetical protein